MVQRKAVRASGEPTSGEVAKEASEALTEPLETEVLPEERKRELRTPGFSRMRTDWSGDDRKILVRVKDAVDGRILREFSGAYEVMNQVYDLVRTPVVNENGEAQRDKWGFVVWQRTQSGGFDEDFSRLTRKQKEHLLFLVTTRIVEWESKAADIWGESMLSKGKYEERFSLAFDSPMSGTVDDRKAVGNIDAADERYFALFMAVLSRKADALVRSMNNLAQRLKDSLAF